MAGLPTPDYQTRAVTTRGTFYPDFFWREQGIIAEVDGAMKYANAAAFVDEKVREQILRDLGYGVARWLAREIMLTSLVVIERVARALDAWGHRSAGSGGRRRPVREPFHRSAGHSGLNPAPQHAR